MDASLKRLPREELVALHRKLMWFYERYAERLFAHLPAVPRALARAYYLGNIKFHFDIHGQNHYSDKAWPMACTAGQSTIVIDHDGHFRACELRPKVGRLQDFACNLSAALASAEMQEEVKAIPGAKCWCTHSCWIHTSSKFSPRVLLFHIPWAYLKSRWQRLPEIQVQELQRFQVKDAPVIS